MKIASLIVILSILSLSTGAAADCLVLLPPTEVPFSGIALPSNAEMRLVDPFLDPIILTLPDGTIRTLEVRRDDVGEIVALPDDLQPLPIGSYQFTISELSGAFNVSDAIDDVSPSAPIVAVTRDSTFTPPSLWPFEECPRQVGSYSFDVFTVDGSERGDVVLLDGVVAAVTYDGTTVFSKPESDSPDGFELRLRDAAGNESEATIATAAGGCGCASTDTSIATSLVVLGIASRRRRTCR